MSHTNEPIEQAVILAAGYGSRLNTGGVSKPLVPVNRTPLIEHAVRQAVSAGVRNIMVVTGHRAGDVAAALPALAARYGVGLASRRTEDWSRPNGYSVLTGARDITGRYLLMMADHLFAPTLLPRLIRGAHAGHGAVLAIDRRVCGDRIDPGDATWVATGKAGMIRAIGKRIDPYDAVDCGAFVVGPDLGHAIQAAIAMGKPGGLSDGMQILADANRAATVDIGDSWWIDVDDARALALAEAQLPDHAALIPEPAA